MVCIPRLYGFHDKPDLVGYNKKNLHTTIGAPCSTHNTRLLKALSTFQKVLKGDIFLDRVFSLGDYVYLPLVTNGDSGFQQFTNGDSGFQQFTNGDSGFQQFSC